MCSKSYFEDILGSCMALTRGCQLLRAPCMFVVRNVQNQPAMVHLTVWCGIQGFYLEEIRVFQAGARLEYISME